MRKQILLTGLSVAALILGACVQLQSGSQENDATVIHHNVITLDTHVDIPLTYMTPEMDPGMASDAQVDLGKMEIGGLDAAFFIVYTPQTKIAEGKYAEAKNIADTRYAAIQKLTEKYNDRIELARTADDVRRIHKVGKRVALIGMENAFPLGASVTDVPMWEKRGVRYMGITHMGHNQFGDSSNPKVQWGETDAMHGGLSPLGKELIKAMNDAGIMVDVSHAAKSTMMQAVALSRVPVIASHSGIMELAENARNLDDEQLRAIADNNGVTQVVAFAGYVKGLTDAQEDFKMSLRKEMGLETDKALYGMDEATKEIYLDRIKAMYELSPRANVADYVNHIDHAVKIAGIDHVGIASDFDGGGGIVGWKNASETLNITKELTKRGYSETDIEKIWSGNLLRVLEAVQEGARK